MKVLFLDIDGVLNSHTWFSREGAIRRIRSDDEIVLSEFDPTAVARLQRVLDVTKAEIVLSSSWRILPSNYEAAQRGVGQKFLGRTVNHVFRNGNFLARGYEIQAWLQANADRNVEAFAAVDDDTGDEWPEEILERFVHTSWQTGLLDEHVDQLIALLGPAGQDDGGPRS